MSLIHSMLGEAQSLSAPPAVAGDPVNRWSPYSLSILRIITAFVYAVHGTQKLFGFPAPFPVPHLPPLFLVGGMIETFGGLLLLIGLLTRPVAFVLSGEMAVAYFKFHAQQGFWPLLNDVRAGFLPNESYRMVARFGVSAAPIPASTRTISTAHNEMFRFTGSSLMFGFFFLPVCVIALVATIVGSS